MYNFYEYFNISDKTSISEIIAAYKNKILIYNNYTKLTDRQSYEIKMLKIGLYILTNKNLKKKYNKIINLRNKSVNTLSSINIKSNNNLILDSSENIKKSISDSIDNKDQKSISDSIDNKDQKSNDILLQKSQEYTDISLPLEHNLTYEMNLDSQFNIDNSWMKHINKNENNKKDRIQPNTIGDRIFSIPLLNDYKKFPAEFEIELRKKHQCRDQS